MACIEFCLEIKTMLDNLNSKFIKQNFADINMRY
jgi:hypothetical protein